MGVCGCCCFLTFTPTTPRWTAVLLDADSTPLRSGIHLGDALGYGPHPREVLDILRDLDAVCVMGNHDQMLLDYADGRREPPTTAWCRWRCVAARPPLRAGYRLGAHVA